MIARMRILSATVCLAALASSAAFAQCAPAPDSAYFFRNLSEQRAQARIDGDRNVYEAQLSDTFASRDADGRTVSRAAFIEAELQADDGAPRVHAFSISNYTLVEHRKGHTVATYLLRESATDGSQEPVRETQFTEVYEVVGRKWRLTAVEAKPAAPNPQLTRAED